MIWSGQNINRCFAISTSSNEVVIGQGFYENLAKNDLSLIVGVHLSSTSSIWEKIWKDKKQNKKYTNIKR